MADKRLLSFLGICRRAGKIVFGLDAAIKEIKKGNIKIVFLASDASGRAKQETGRAGMEIGIDVVPLACTMFELGCAIGRSNTAVAGITDQLLADRAKELCRAD